MDFSGEFSDVSEAHELKGEQEYSISKEEKEKFDKLMGDDKLEDISIQQQDDKPRLSPAEIEDKFNRLFDTGDFFKKENEQSNVSSELTKGMVDTKTDTDEQSKDEESKTEISQNKTDINEQSEEEPDYIEKREPNSTYEFNGNIYETDDNGQTYKKNGKLLPNVEYTLNGITYKTDENGNKIHISAKHLKYTEEGQRNTKEQRESGGEERREDDEGGHIIARILGGAAGLENLVAMRRTINRGDYKKMENEIVKALKEGKDVSIQIDIEYDENSGRPLKIRAEYTIDGKKTVYEFDNVEGSTDLLSSLEGKISDEDYDRLKQNLNEMNEDGGEATITSVKTEYDENGNPTKITVGVLDETTGTKTYKEYILR